ncbi:MAG: GntP family permease [Planctomycetota bacterium]
MAVTLYQLAVLLAGIGLLMGLVVRGKSIFVAAPLCALVMGVLSGRDPVTLLSGTFANGFAEYMKNFYLLFALGAAFGKLLEDAGAATSIANQVGHWLGRDRACLSVVLACALLTYGGVSLFVVGFAVFPLAVQLFRAANLPRRFIPAAIAFGSITFTMTSAGSPEIQNLIPIKYLVDAANGAPLTDARAGWKVSLIVAPAMWLVGQWYLEHAIRRARRDGENWHDLASDIGGALSPATHATAVATASATTTDSGSASSNSDTAASIRGSAHGFAVESTLPRPSLAAAVAPLATTVLALNALPPLCRAAASLLPASATWLASALAAMPEDPVLALSLGVAAAWMFLPHARRNAWTSLGQGFLNGLIAIAATASMVGFGAVVKELPAFSLVVEAVTRIPGDPLIGAAISVAIIAAIAGSASGGQGIALPLLKPLYVDELGVAPRALHRVISIASGTLDSLPANGYVVTLIQNICGETHRRAYGPLFVTTVLLPIAGTGLAIALFKLFPSWALS